MSLKSSQDYSIGDADSRTPFLEDHGLEAEPYFEPLNSEKRNTLSSKKHIPIKVYLYSMCALLNSSNLGYDMGVNTSASKSLQRSMKLSDVQLEMFIGSLAIFSMLGAMVNSPINDRFGRRGGFLASNVFCILGMGTDAIAKNYTQLMLGKLLVGMGVGIGMATNPLYIAELAPVEYRGYFVTWCDIGMNFGMVLGYFVGFLRVADSESDVVWRYMFALGMVFPVIIISFVLFAVLESPRWLVQKNRIDEASKVLLQLYGQDHDVSTAIENIKVNIATELKASKSVSWSSMLFCPRPAIFRVLLVGLGLSFFHDFVGIAAIQYYMTNIVEKAGLSTPHNITVVLIVLGSLKVLFGCMAAFLFDKYGRRVILALSLAGCTVASTLMAFSFYKDLPHTFVVYGLLVYLCFYSFGMGPGAWVVASEIFPLGIRAKAMGLAIFLNRGTAAASTSSFLTLVDHIGYSGFFFVTTVQCLLSFLFILIYVPETKGISLEEMTAYFAEVTRNPSFMNLMFGYESSESGGEENLDDVRDEMLMF